MNKHCFRVIFSKTLQCLVVTSELAKTEGKSSERASGGFLSLFCKIRPLTFSLYCALGFVAFSNSALANLIIQADKSAPKNQQPIVLQTANGLPQVNIQTPNDKGLSHNKYSKFDVDTKGAILNNSRTNVQTQQGGWVQGNPYLARGEAKVILNEVNSSDPSILKGYVEVAGRKADVIIANPSGLHCEGCGIINSDRATFTTGKPQINNGHLDSFVVEKGKVKVSGKGLDNSRVDYTEIIARETQANAGIWSKKETKVITGKNTVKRSDTPSDLQIIHTKQPLETETQPQFAIDVGELGGMYSGKIHLIGTEQGVGVRNAGHIGASAENLKIDSEGRIINTGTINAQQEIQLTGNQGIENKGKIENRQGHIQLSTPATIKQDGSIVARGGNISKQAKQQITQQGESVAKGNISYKSSQVAASNSSIIAAGIDIKDTEKGEARILETTSVQGKNITVTTTNETTLQGKNIASGKFQVNATEVNLNQSQSAANFIDISATQGGIQANNAAIVANRDLALATPKKLQTQHSTVKAQGDLTLNAKGLNNQQGHFLAEGKLAINASNGKVDTTQGILASKQDMSLTSGELVNDAGLIQSHQNIKINTQGQTLSNQQTLTETQDKGIVALGNLTVQTATLNNQQGGIYSRDTTSITADQRINNQQGELLSANAISIKNNGDLMVNNQNGLIQGQNTIDLTAKGLEVEGSIKTAGNLSIDLKDSFTLNQAFEVGNNLTFNTQGDFTNNVKQVVGNQATFTTNHLINPVNAEISSNRTLINTTTLTNNGLLDGKENIIKTNMLNNLGTGRIYGDHLAIQAESLNNLNQDEASATIAARHRLDLGVGTLVNRDHSLIFSLGDIAIGGQLDENNQAQGYAKFIDNGSATLEALGNGNIKTQRLLNHDLYLKLGEYHTDEHIIEYAPAKSSKRYALLNKDGSEGRFELKNNDKHDSNSYFILKNGTRIASRYWMNWNYNRHTVTSTIEYRDPANILIGGHLSLSGADLENNASNLSVGKTLLLGDSTFTRNENNNNLTAGDVTLKNIDILGTIDIKDTGIWGGFGKERRRYGARGKKRWAVYGTGSGEINEVHPTQHFAFEKVLNEIGTEITSTNTQIAQQSTPSAVISGQVSALHPANLDQNMQPVIKTHLADITLPQASLYKINPDAPNGYLVETDPKFTDRKQWLSSDYMFNALRHDHNVVQKRLGDGFYEQRLVNEQIHQLTGRRFLEHYNSDFEQYKALMDSGIYYANKFNLSLGVGLTAQQMAELTSDMVWFVNKEVRLPSGKTLTVLTPQVYLVARNLDVTSQGALISAREIVGDINGDIQNSGTIAGRNLTSLAAKNIQNYGVVLGDTVNLNVEQRLINLGGKIQALDSATLLAGQGVDIASQTSSSANTDSSGNAFAHTSIDRQADIHIGGKLTIYSPKDVTVKAANLSADIIHLQGNQVELGTVTTHNKQHYNGDADNYYRLDQTQEVGSQLTAKNDINILSKNRTALRQASVHSDNGTVAIGSTHGDVQIQEGRNQEQLSFGAKSTHHGTLQTITSVTKHDHRYDTAQASAIDGNNVVLQANNGNVSVQGSNVVAENHLVAKAKNISIQAAENRVFEEDFEKTGKSGLMGSGGFGFSVGSKKEKVEQDRMQESAASSQVGSLKGDTVLHADNHYQQMGSVVTAVNGDVDILAKSANITAAHSDYESNYKYTYEQKGLTIALSAPALALAQAMTNTYNAVKTVGKSKDDRINALAVANTAWSAYRLANSMPQPDLKNNIVADKNAQPSTTVGISITYGQQKNVSTTHTEGNTAQSSEINAGGKVNIVATGAGKQSDINIIGSDVSGKQGTSLKTDNDINLLAAKQAHQERSTNKSSGFNAGVAIQIGSGISLGITAGGNYGKGYGNGDETTYTYTHVGDKNSQTTLESGLNTSLKGAQVQGKGVKLDAQNLNIESLQETLTYKGKQMNVSGQVTAGYGFSASGSYSQSKMNADYASVIEQSGIYAGDDGYQVNIQSHTDLKGGLITSSQTAEDNGNNRFETGTLSYSDIRNHADYSGSSFGVGGGFSMGGGDSPKEIGGMKLTSFGQNAMVETVNADGSKTANLEGQMNINKSVGFGYDSEHNDSVTKSGINTVNIQIRDKNAQITKTGQTVNAALTGIHSNVTTESAVENSGKLEQNFDKEQLQKELNTQLEVTQTFDKNRQELKAEYYATIDKKREEATEIRRKNGGYDTEDSKKLDQEANDLNEQIRWIDMGLGLAWGLGNADMTQLMFGTTQADRAYRSATAPKEMWIQHCSSSQSKDCQSRQIWSLDDLTTEERTRLENEDILVVSNPGIFNDREDALKNAQKQNKSDANQNGIITIMNPPTGDYKGWGGWKLATALPSELLYAFYDKLNDSLFNGVLPLTNSEKLNQDVYLEAKAKNYTLDTSNHSRGGMTASVALQNLNIWRGINDIPIRKARFYGTATNVQAYSNQLNKNGFTYQGKDGKTYQSGAYSAVHHSDGVGLIPVLLGGNSSTGGACVFCYSHSSYFAEIPNEYLIDINGSLIKSSLYEQYEHIWGAINSRKENLSIPTLVEPTNLNGVIDEKAF